MKNNLLSERLTYNGDNCTHTHVHLLNYSSDHFSETICNDFEEIMSHTPTENKLWIRVHGLKDTAYIRNIFQNQLFDDAGHLECRPSQQNREER